MNDTFREFLDDFLIIYLDDLLIYSDSLAEHKRHVRRVLERLRDAKLCLKPSKCQFHVEEVAFLGFLVGPRGIRMDPGKVDSITSWPAPKSPHDIRVFLGLANFYRRFIKNFSELATPITALLRKNRKFEWTDEAQSAFDELRAAFTSAPILRHFDPSLPVVLEADASDFAVGAVISQRDPESGLLHPITFHSRKFNSAELNYEIYDKEMLAIVETMDQYRHYFEGLGHATTVLSDHRNLLWFTETKVYNRRQARWAEKLSRFDFKIVFRPGKQGGKPDALSRRPDYTLGKVADERTMTFLKPSQIDTSLLPTDDPVLAAIALFPAQILDAPILDEFSDSLRTALDEDDTIATILSHLREPELPRSEELMETLAAFALNDRGFLLHHDLIYVPANDALKLEILKQCHDAKTAGHLGQEKTLEMVTRNYYWPGMRAFVKQYCRTCDTCARNKTPRHAPYGQLRPLPIPDGVWDSVSMDFVVELPESDGYNTIYVCVDRLTKMAHFIPTTTTVDSEQTAKLYYRHVFKNHGLPRDIVSDRGPQFVSQFTRHLLEKLEIQGNRSTSHHPQSDGQTERVNQTLEQYLRVYCDYQQNDWHELLPLAEFVYNNSQNASTRMSPFFANYGYHPRILVHAAVESANPSVEALTAKLQVAQTELKANLSVAQEQYKTQYDRHTRPAPEHKVGDKVWLLRRNIHTTRPSQKLDVKRMGPFRILEVVGDAKSAFRLELPHQMKIHNVFHVSLLEPYLENTFEGRVQAPPPPEEVDGVEEFQVKEIVDSKVSRRKLLYLVEWEGYGPNDRTWEPVEHLTHAEEAVTAYHLRYPQRPAPHDIPQRPAGPRRRRRR
jgi:transposase InsO family protein